MSNLHIKLLKELERTGLNRSHDISDFMDTNFKKPIMLEHDNLSDDFMVANQFLSDLKELGHINVDLKSFKESVLVLKESIPIKSDHWFDNNGFSIRLCIKGSEFLQQYKYSVQSTFIAGTALVVAFASMFASGIVAYVELNNYHEQQVIQTVLRDTKLLKSQQQKLKSEITSLKVQSHTHWPSSLDTLRTTLSKKRSDSPKKNK